MDALRFDRLRRSLRAGSSRRGALQWLATAALNLGIAGRFPGVTRAKKRKKKLRYNTFGCVNVGGKCRGKDAKCCSGICQGKKPKKGEKDKSHCVAHDAASCQAGDTLTICGGLTDVECTSSSGELGTCGTTTGNAGYCLKDAACAQCTKDSDCIPMCGSNAACIVCDFSKCLTAGITTLCGAEVEGGCSAS
jgi:hypothetical protein